jgi:signal transduction histidine kinase
VVSVSALMAATPVPDLLAPAGAGRTTGRAPVRFVVENPGPGIAPGDIRLLFQRFQQLDG